MPILRLKIPPPVYMLSVAGFMWLAHHYLPLWQLISPPWHQLGLILIGLAIVADFWSLGLFFRAHTTFNPIHPERTRELVTSGPYRYSRNPMYVGMLIILTGWACYLGSLSPWFFLPVFVLVLNQQQIIPEEKVLAEKFADAYLEYKAQVPRWFW